MNALPVVAAVACIGVVDGVVDNVVTNSMFLVLVVVVEVGRSRVVVSSSVNDPS